MSQHPEGVWGLHPHMDADAEPSRATLRSGEEMSFFSRCIAVGDMTIATVAAYEGGAGWPSISLDQVEPTARRIIACVNACNGLSTEDLEAGAVSLAFNRDYPGSDDLISVLAFALSYMVEQQEGIVQLKIGELHTTFNDVVKTLDKNDVGISSLTLLDFNKAVRRSLPTLLQKYEVRGESVRRQGFREWKFYKSPAKNLS